MQSKKMITFLVILFCIIGYEVNAQKSIEVPRPDGSFIFGYFSEPGTKNYPIALIMQGSGKDSVQNTYKKFSNRFLELGIASISIEKRGIQPGKPFNEKEYHLHNYLDSRVSDYRTLVHFLHKKYSDWNDELIVIGGSSGGDTAIKFSTQMQEVKLLVLISAGGGDSNRNAMIDSFRLILEKQGVSKSNTEEYMEFLDKKFTEMMSNPTTHKIFDGYTYRWWAETLNYRPVNDLIHFNNPVFMYHGTSDIYCPVKYADLVNDAFNQKGKENLHYRRIGDCGHNAWDCDNIKILEEITHWIKANLEYIKSTEQMH